MTEIQRGIVMKRIIVVLVSLILMTSAISMSIGAVAEENSYINIGDYGPEVVALHQKLADLGYFSLRPESPWSAKSETALKGVQYVVGLEETGRIDSRDAYDAIMGLDPEEPVFAIKRIQGIDEYLEYIREHELTIFISVRDEASKKLQNSTKERFKEFGLKTDWYADRIRMAYIAVIESGNHVLEEIAATDKTGAALSTYGVVGNIEYTITSAGYENDGGPNSSIKLNDQEYSRNRLGFNIVVVENGNVIDSVSFDTYGEEEAEAKR